MTAIKDFVQTHSTNISRDREALLSMRRKWSTHCRRAMVNIVIPYGGSSRLSPGFLREVYLLEIK